MQSKTRLNSITLLGELQTQNGVPVMVAMHLKPEGKNGKIMNMIKISNSYARNNTQGLIDTSDILYVEPNKKRTNDWLRAFGLQLPVRLTQYGSISKVTYYEKGVNNKDNDFSNNVFADALKRAGITKPENVENASGKKKFSLEINLDSEGSELSEGQMDFFKESKVVDQEGRLMVMYYGTPQGGFTVFKNDLQFFTQNKAYADNYQNPSASSRNSRKEEINRQTYEVYLNITKSFDIRDKKTREIFINDYVKGGYALGINPYTEYKDTTNTGLHSWEEADNIYEFLEENDLLNEYCCAPLSLTSN